MAHGCSGFELISSLARFDNFTGLAKRQGFQALDEASEGKVFELNVCGGFFLLLVRHYRLFFLSLVEVIFFSDFF